MKFDVSSLAGPQKPRLFGKAMRRVRQGILNDLFSQLENVDISGVGDSGHITLMICEEHSLEYWKEDLDPEHTVISVGVAPGLTYKKQDDAKFAIFVIERIRFFLQHKGFLTPALASLLREHIDGIRSSDQWSHKEP